METSGIKRRIMSSYEFDGSCNNKKYPINSSRIFVDAATNTDNDIMTITSWTQTEISDIKAQEQKNLDCLNSNVEQLTERIRKLENIIYFQNKTISNGDQNYDLNSNINNNLRKPIHGPVSEQSKYKIISEGVEVNIEPVDVVYSSEECIGMDGDLNTSNDSERLEICLPKECAEDDKINVISKVNGQPNYQHYYRGTQFKSSPNCHQIIAVSESSNLPNTSGMQWRYVHPQPKFEAVTENNRNNNQPSTSESTLKIEERTIHPSSTTPNYQPRSYELDRVSIPINDNQNGVSVMGPTVSIGPNNTHIPTHIYQTMDWSATTVATRKLLTTIFDRETLATHSMTGKPSPAFKGRTDKPAKLKLKPEIVSDIVYAVSHHCKVSEKEVKNAITTKCADENKMFKQRENKRKSLAELNKENLNGKCKMETNDYN